MNIQHRLMQGSLFGVLLLTGIIVWRVISPPETIPVDSVADAPYYQNPVLLERAWAQPVAAAYKPAFEYQINAAFCGPAAIVNVFRSLGVGEYTQENVFDNAEVSYWKARILGLTLDEMAELVKAHNSDHWEVTVWRDLTLDEFRAHLRSTNDPAHRYLINFNRGPLFGVVIGHHSPLGGYLEDQDLVFVLDVLEDYQPFLVPAARLYEAMDTVDSETGQKRGLIRVSSTLTTSRPMPWENTAVTQ
jgi:hypothetical protein